MRMQLKLSLITATLLITAQVQAEDYVSVQFLQYSENNSLTSVSAPSIMVNKDIGTDYTINMNLVSDSVSGASQTYTDVTSGASPYSRGNGINSTDAKYSKIDYEENRVAGNILLTKRFENRDELTAGISYSAENDFYSSQASLQYKHWLDASKNQAISFGGAYQSNEILDRCPLGSASTCDSNSGASEKMDSTAINLQLGYYQTIDDSSYIDTTLFYSNDDGFLTNPYLNVVRNNNGITADIVQESRPDSRTSYGIAFQYAKALNNNLSLHLGYRYYTNDWKINSHTLESDIYYEYNSDLTLSLGLRYYQQSEADFYNKNSDYFTNQKYASSDERLSNFNAITYKSTLDYKISEDFSVNLGINFYNQSTDLSALYFVSGFTYRF